MRPGISTIHQQLFILKDDDDELPKKHKAFFDALSGEGIVQDVDVADTLTFHQTRSIVLEYVERLYLETGNEVERGIIRKMRNDRNE